MSLALRAYIPAVLWVAFILGLGSISDASLPTTDLLPLDKVAHLVLYGVLGALLAAGWVRLRRPGRVWLILIGLGVAVVDELHQRSVSGRSAEIADFVADAAGITLAFYMTLRLMTRDRRGRVGSGSGEA